MIRKILLFILLFAIAAPVHAQQTTTNFDNPREMLQTYYNAINKRDFDAAFSLWRQPQQSFEDFQAGFWRTMLVTPYFSELRLGDTPRSGLIQAVLVTQETDYSLQDATAYRVYAGCFFVSRQSQLGDWLIDGAQLSQVLDYALPDIRTIQALLDENCIDNLSAAILGTHSPAAPMERLQQYFSYINTSDLATAYQFWLTPAIGLPQEYRLPYDQFVAGYAETSYISVYTGVYSFGGATAGAPYLDGMLPVVLVGQNKDGSFEAFGGCFALGFDAQGNLGIVNGEFYTMTSTVPDGSLIVEYLQIDCVQLGMDL